MKKKKHILLTIFGILVLFVFVLQIKKFVRRKQLEACLPKGIEMSDFVTSAGHRVEEKLDTLGARCISGKTLIDQTGREITFYFFYAGGGVDIPLDDMMKALNEQENKTKSELEKKYTVIYMEHNPHPGEPIP